MNIRYSCSWLFFSHICSYFTMSNKISTCVISFLSFTMICQKHAVMSPKMQQFLIHEKLFWILGTHRFLKESGDTTWKGFWGNTRMRGRGNRGSVKSAGTRESRWAERSRLTFKTHLRITADYCAKSDSLALQAKRLGGPQMCSPWNSCRRDRQTEADTVTLIQRSTFCKKRISGMSLTHCWPPFFF